MSELTPLSEMIAFKKSGHATSASLAKMLWEPGTDMKRKKPEDTAHMAGLNMTLQQENDSLDNDEMAHRVNVGRVTNEMYPTGADSPRAKDSVAEQHRDDPRTMQERAQTTKEYAELVANDDKGLSDEYANDMEGWGDLHYALEHPEDSECAQLIAGLKRKYPHARMLQGVSIAKAGGANLKATSEGSWTEKDYRYGVRPSVTHSMKVFTNPDNPTESYSEINEPWTSMDGVRHAPGLPFFSQQWKNIMDRSSDLPPEILERLNQEYQAEMKRVQDRYNKQHFELGDDYDTYNIMAENRAKDNVLHDHAKKREDEKQKMIDESNKNAKQKADKIYSKKNAKTEKKETAPKDVKATSSKYESPEEEQYFDDGENPF